MTYQAWVASGILIGFIISRLQPDERPDLKAQRPLLYLSAIIGALLGAFICEWPADYYHWTALPSGLPRELTPMGGRTVLGGLIGGWLMVEICKWRLRIRGPTGDGFALPLAMALTFGRLGCASAGCCAGMRCPVGAWWRPFASAGPDGCERFPAALVEAGFHAAAALIITLCIWRGWLRGRRLTIYLIAYAVLRFVSEFARANPAIAWGLTYYQFLALALLGLAGVVWWRRTREALTF